MGVTQFRIAQTTPNPQALEQVSSLVTSGIYQYSRNPMVCGLGAYIIRLGVLFVSPSGVCIIAYFYTLYDALSNPARRADDGTEIWQNLSGLSK